MRDMFGRVYALERALIFRRLRLSLRERFFFHFSLMLRKNTFASARATGKRMTGYEYTHISEVVERSRFARDAKAPYEAEWYCTVPA